MATTWISVPVSDVRVGDRVRHPSGQEFAVARIDSPFLGRQELVCLIESTDVRWHAYPVRVADAIEVQRG